MKILSALKRFSFVPFFILLILFCWLFYGDISAASQRLYTECFILGAAFLASCFIMIEGFALSFKKSSLPSKKHFYIVLFSVLALLSIGLPIFEIVYFNDTLTRELYHSEQLLLLGFEFAFILFGVICSALASPQIFFWLQRKHKQ